ncbi:MAG: BamA/TamA family outer membrane protein [Bacteroidaceae bacterium]|nr:BamA/TamA family outer membrane protein [Bacteroidaceae bacterium]
MKATRRIQKILWTLLLPLGAGLLGACSETKNLAEDETLYTGIKKLAYDAPLEQREGTDTTGVITALAGAYKTVSGLLTGDATAMETLQKVGLTKQQKDSIKTATKMDKNAYAKAKDEVEAVLAYAPNNSLMGSSYHRQPLAFGLWTYNKYIYSKRKFGRWMFNTFAATPIYLTTVNPRVRTQVAQNTLRNYGYFRGQVSHDIVPQKNPRKAKISYQVHPGELFHIDSIAYLDFPERPDSLIRATRWKTYLRKGAPFSVPNLDSERNRLSNLFRDDGYYYFRPEHIVYRADTIVRPLHVQLQVIPSPETPDNAMRRYYMGKTQINVYEYEARELVDTIGGRGMQPPTKHKKGKHRKGKFMPPPSGQRRGRRQITMAYSGKKGSPPLKMRAIRRYINYRSGDPYSLTAQNAMQTNLANMGIFSQLSMRYVPRDTTATCDTLDVEITARLDKPYDAEFKGNIATKSNGLVGPGASFSMSKQNVFRGAETLSFSIYGSYEWMTGAQMKGKHNLLNSFEYGTSLNLTYPRLLLLGLGKRLDRRAQATTTYKISADWMNRSGYFSRVSFGLRVMHTYQRIPTVRHEIVPFRLDYEKQLHTTAKFDNIIANNQALYASLRDQFVPSAQYAVTFTNKNRTRYDRRLTLLVKEGGNLTSAVYCMTGKSFTQKDKDLFGVPFAQFLKFTAEFTESFRLFHTKTHLVAHIFAGIVYSYGNSTMAPYNDLFTVGGANSIRAFGVRSIGPGSYHPSNSNYSYLDQMGDLKLEANLEYRFPLVSKLYGAMFVDAGNVWLRKSDPNRPGGTLKPSRLGKDIALGTGFGLRYDLDFLVIRFDIGVGIHAPYDTGKSGYYNMTKFWDSLGFHLAVGYPF